MTKWFRFLALTIAGIAATAVLFVAMAAGSMGLVQLYYRNEVDRGGEAGWLFFFLSLPLVALLSMLGGILVGMVLHKKFG